ncbi:hypothetical protein [Vibrio breoganii]|uniref:hypothetical protein n=1 Tax=Vibrio breoganii TaxID=553239 RepID=UPI0011130886|nr:hypothetical protein [Vibrio breoganii]
MKQEQLLGRIIVAKDAMFGLVTHIVSPQGKEEYYKIIFSILAIVLIHRVLLIRQIGFSFIIYFPLYIICLSPGLDYAAIRSLLGLNFIVIYLILNRLGVLFFILSMFSHLSMLPSWLFMSKPFNRIVCRYSRWLVGIVIVSGSFIVTRGLYLLPSTATYIDNEGSWLLFFRVLSLLMPVYFLSVTYSRIVCGRLDFTQRLLDLSLFLSFVSLGAIKVGIASNRMHEMACFFILIGVCSFGKKHFRNRWVLFLSGIILVVVIGSSIYRNTQSELWHLLFTLPFH